MAIQMRRGEYGKFDPEKLLPAEWAVVLSGDPNTQDGRAAYLCFDAGNVKRMVTQEDLQKDIEMAVGDIKDTVVKESIEKVKEDALDSKVDKVTGKGLSSNDYTTEEKNNAYDKLTYLNTVLGEEEKLENKIKSKLNVDSFVEIDNNQINVIAISKNHDVKLANNIMRTVQEEYKEKVYVTVNFK